MRSCISHGVVRSHLRILNRGVATSYYYGGQRWSSSSTSNPHHGIGIPSTKGKTGEAEQVQDTREVETCRDPPTPSSSPTAGRVTHASGIPEQAEKVIGEKAADIVSMRKEDTPSGSSPAAPPRGSSVPNAEPEPRRWIQRAYEDPDAVPIVDEKGHYIVSRVLWPTGEVAYRTPEPVNDKLAPRFGYNIVQVKKHVSWWKYNQKYPRLSLAYINIQVLFLLGVAWLVAFLTTEYRRTTEAMRTPGAMVGEHRGKGPSTQRTQKIAFEKGEMSALLDKAQSNWFDGAAEASYVGSKEYRMKKIERPKEFSIDDLRKR